MSVSKTNVSFLPDFVPVKSRETHYVETLQIYLYIGI